MHGSGNAADFADLPAGKFDDVRNYIYQSVVYIPIITAISGLPAEWAEYPVVEGKQVHIVTGRQLYEDANAGLIRHESIRAPLKIPAFNVKCRHSPDQSG